MLLSFLRAKKVLRVWKDISAFKSPFSNISNIVKLNFFIGEAAYLQVMMSGKMSRKMKSTPITSCR